MSYNKQLVYWIVGLFSAAFILVSGVFCYDRRETLVGVVDHLFDFHLNESAIQDEIERLKAEKKDKDRRVKDLLDEIYFRDSRDSGGSGNDRGDQDHDSNRDRS